MVIKSSKVKYFAHLEEALNKYCRAAIVEFDFVGSKQISNIRVALRGKAEMVHGKNTMIRTCIRNMIAKSENEGIERPDLQAIVDIMKGNIGFIFTNGDIGEIKDVLTEHVKPAAAKAGVIAPCGCIIPKGPTGLDPAQTSFFQALNIATKINKGTIEIINDCTVLLEGNKVGTSEAALLLKLGVKPFEYGLRMLWIFEGGIFSPKVLEITDAELAGKFTQGVGFVASLSLALGILTEASLAFVIVSGFKNVLAVALEVEYIEFDAVKKVKALLE